MGQHEECPPPSPSVTKQDNNPIMQNDNGVVETMDNNFLEPFVHQVSVNCYREAYCNLEN